MEPKEIDDSDLLITAQCCYLEKDKAGWGAMVADEQGAVHTLNSCLTVNHDFGSTTKISVEGILTPQDGVLRKI